MEWVIILILLLLILGGWGGGHLVLGLAGGVWDLLVLILVVALIVWLVRAITGRRV